MADEIDFLDFYKPQIIGGLIVGWEMDWDAYHAACDRRDAQTKLTVIEGGKPLTTTEEQ